MACAATPKYEKCAVCHTPLSVQEQALGGLCDYHHYQSTKDD
jgi:hypothetical protein